MRPKFVLVVVFVAVAIVAGIVFLKQRAVAPKPVAAPVSAESVAPAPAPVPVVVKKAMTSEDQQAAIDTEKDKLSEWEMNNDSQSLSNILGDLTSSEKEIREAAIEATKQFGSTNAIPVLKALAANDTDNQEAIEMLQAADFIALPDAILAKHSDAPLTPEQQQRRAQSEAHRQIQIQAHSDGRPNSQTSSTGQTQAPAQP